MPNKLKPKEENQFLPNQKIPKKQQLSFSNVKRLYF